MEQVLVISLGVVSVITLVNLFLIYRLNKRFNRVLGGKKSKESIENQLGYYFDKVNITENKFDEIKQNYNHLSDIAKKSIQKISVVRFNPFANAGGDQSFAVAMLDNHDSGLIMTAIHSREGTRIYLKPVTYGNSKHNLSKEEAEALKEAKSEKERG